MARNLSRNTKLFVSTVAPANINTTNCVGLPAVAGTNNTWKVNVLDGYSFSQDTSTQEIGVSESASECVGAGGLARGTLSFNTALNPVDVSFSVYVRPTNTGGDNPGCVELPFWAAAFGTATNLTNSPDTPANGAVWNETTGATDTITFTTENSDVNELLTLYLYFVLENTTYVVNEFSVGTIEADFSIDGIAMLNISGSGTSLQENPSAVHDEFKTGGTLVADTDYVDVPVTTSSSFLRNKLGTFDLSDNQGVKTTGDQSGLLTSISGQAITTDINITTANEYDGGRIYNADTDAWATIVSHTTGAASVVTVSDNDDVSTWDDAPPNDLDIFLPGSHAAVEYCIPITGGTLTVENNMSYLTPEELAIVNQPLAGFTGNRSISGSVTAYLNTGAQGTAGLLDDLLQKITEVSNDYAITMRMGNASGTNPRVDFIIPHAQVSIPTTNVEDIISTEISFAAKSWNATNNEQSFEGANEMTVVYNIA